MAGRPGVGAGRPPLTERRREATRMEIADEAVRLFVERGVAGTTAEDIAAGAGISTRTLWRYFRSKEECVRPLLTVGIDVLTERLRDHWRGDRTLAQAISAIDDPGIPVAQHLETLRGLVRLSRDEPGLRAVWLEAHFDAEGILAGLIAEATDRSEEDLAVRLEAGMMNSALRIAVEHWALQPHEPTGPPLGATLGQALQAITRFLDADASPSSGWRPLIHLPAMDSPPSGEPHPRCARPDPPA
ncbi:TetR family transcriptional regulator [Streptomyces sp. NPDC002588]|uniref:TetR/AcrR family transcriptional regulator n=1 Tax=Streptomyces sp. NPDC002588 TaxID=3154419 RepID=UPI003322EA12